MQALNAMRLVFVCLCLILVSCSGRSSVSPERVIEYANIHGFDNVAHWADQQTIILPDNHSASRHFLIAFPEGMNGGTKPSIFQISPKESSEYNRPGKAYKIYMKDTDIHQVLEGEIFIACLDRGELTSLHLVQTAEVLDHVFETDGIKPLGAHLEDKTTTFRLWAPTAKLVNVQIYNEQLMPVRKLEMEKSRKTGVWSVSDAELNSGQYYRYKMTIFHPASRKIETYEVTDPYSFGLSANSEFSQIIDLSEPDLEPEGWTGHKRPKTGASPKDIIYRLHVGEYSAFDESQPTSLRGKFKALTNRESHSVKHLEALAQAGVTTVNILPISDFGSVNEIPMERFSLDTSIGEVCDAYELDLDICATGQAENLISSVYLSNLASEDLDKVLSYVANNDAYGQGTDALHLFVPDGSYSSNADNRSRIVETREMIQSLHELGLQVIIDLPVHFGADVGQNIGSVLDKTVPRYYFVSDPVTGNIVRGKDGPEMAIDRKMAQKIISDAREFWALNYGIDGFNLSLSNQWRNVLEDDQISADMINSAVPNKSINYLESYGNLSLRTYLNDSDTEFRKRKHINAQAALMLTPGIPLVQSGTEFNIESNRNDPDTWPFAITDWVGDEIFESLKDFITIRNSSPLFVLEQNELQQKLNIEMVNSETLVMTLNDQSELSELPDLDPRYAQIIVVFNKSKVSQKIPVNEAGKLRLHPTQVNGSDRFVRRSQIMFNHVVVPPHSTAVFVRPQ